METAIYVLTAFTFATFAFAVLLAFSQMWLINRQGKLNNEINTNFTKANNNFEYVSERINEIEEEITAQAEEEDD